MSPNRNQHSHSIEFLSWDRSDKKDLSFDEDLNISEIPTSMALKDCYSTGYCTVSLTSQMDESDVFNGFGGGSLLDGVLKIRRDFRFGFQMAFELPVCGYDALNQTR